MLQQCGMPRRIQGFRKPPHAFEPASPDFRAPSSSPMADKNNHGFDLPAAPRRILTANGFEPDYDAAAKKQLDAIAGPAPAPAGVRDLRDKPWSSIDNNES